MFLRFVVPTLSGRDVQRLESGDLGIRGMNALVRAYIGEHISFRAWSCDPNTAAFVEQHIRAQGLPTIGKPFFNPT